MNNKTKSSFIPYQNSAIIERYSMVSSFDSSGNEGLTKIKGKYENYLNSLVPGARTTNGSAISKAINNLQLIVNQEREAEINFLNEVGDLLKIKIADNEVSWGELIKLFNLVFSTENIFKRNISKLRELEARGGKGQKYQDITHFFQSTYLPKAISEFMPIKSVKMINDKLVLRIMRRAVQLMFADKDRENRDTKESQEMIQCYKEIWEALQTLTYRNRLFKNLVNLFNLKEYLTNNLTKLNNTQSYNKYPSITTKSNIHGDVMEEIESVIMNQFEKVGKYSIKSNDIKLEGHFIHTGQTLQKADNISIWAEGRINTSELVKGKQTKDDSVRLRSLERMEELLKQIGSKKAQIVFVSDKNYQIGNNTFHSKMGGFAAETPSLSSLSSYGNQFQIPDIDNIVDYLASAGPGMIVESGVDTCLEVIKASIGTFLFDDLQITTPPNSGVNRVHLLNLSGIYMPASVYLEATLEGLNEVKGRNIDDFVKVKFMPSGSNPSGGGQEAWDAYHASRLTKSKIDIHFMGGFTKFISGLTY